MDRDEELFRELRQIVRDPPPSEPVEAPGLLDHPDAIPGYVLQEELHRGGQGVVYRALQAATRREVALKVLLRGRNASARDRMRFEREIDLASRLRHPNIVTIYDSGVADGRSYFAMELVQGRRLDVHLARRKLPLKERLALFERIAGAVAAAHRRGVIHRDLKPSNILVDEKGEPHILDFGIAKAQDEYDRTRVTATGEFMGTLAYASPEQVSGDPADVDTRSDVYSLGVLLYEMITGRLPYDVSGSMSQAVDHITRRPPEDPRTLGVGVDDELFLVLTAALAKDAGERYPSADALARDVGHYLAEEPLEVRAKSSWYVIRKALARRRAAFAVAGAITILALAGALILVRERLRAERQSQKATLVREVFQDVLGAAAPQRMGSDVTLLEIYEEAAERIEDALEDAPDAQAEFHLAIGDTYRSLMMWPEAAAHLEKALERYRAVDDSRQLEVARCLDRLGRVTSELDPPAALPIVEEALAIRRGVLKADDVDVAESERSVAIVLWRQYADQDHERCQALLLSALAKYDAALGPRSPEVAATKFWLARVAFVTGRFDDGVVLLEEALDIYEEQDERDPRMVDCLQALASAARRRDRFDEARELLDRAVALTTALYGDERDVDMLRAYSDIHFDMGEYATSERLTRRALIKELDSWSQKRPEDEQRIAEVCSRLDSAEPPAAEPPYAEAFEILRAFRGNGAFELASWANGIARTMMHQDRGEAAQPLLNEVLNIRCRAFGLNCPNRSSTLFLLAEIHADLDRPSEAVPLLEEGLDALERVDEADGPKAAEARALLERCRTLVASRSG